MRVLLKNYNTIRGRKGLGCSRIALELKLAKQTKRRRPSTSIEKELNRAHQRMGEAAVYAEQQHRRERAERAEQKRRRMWEGVEVVDEMQLALDAKKKEDEIVYVDPQDQADREERKARPYLGKFRSPAYCLLPDTPRVGPDEHDLKLNDAAGNRRKAGVYCDAIDSVLHLTADEGSKHRLSRFDRSNLRALQKKWRLRADGMSPYYDLWGTLPGKNEVFRKSPSVRISGERTKTYTSMKEITEMLEKELERTI